MSMRDYPVNIYGFYIDHEVAAYAYLKIDRDRDSVPAAIQDIIDKGLFHDLARAGTLPEDYNDISDVQSVMDEDETHFCSDFEGDIDTLLPERTANPISKTVSDFYIVYIDRKKFGDLFHAAYASPEELLQEFKTSIKNQGIKLPDDFDWWAHIVHIYGTTFG